MVGFPGTRIDGDLAALMDDGIYGAILFKRNVGTARETAALCHELKARAGRPFILSVDQEGGRVARLRGAPFTTLPPMRELGQRGDAAQVERVGRLLAHELRAVGFDWDFAPVLDVDTHVDNPVIGDRSFSRDAQEVARLGVALARGLVLRKALPRPWRHHHGQPPDTAPAASRLGAAAPGGAGALPRLRPGGAGVIDDGARPLRRAGPGGARHHEPARAPGRAARGAGLRRRARQR
jgi:hypothetical protein